MKKNRDLNNSTENKSPEKKSEEISNKLMQKLQKGLHKLSLSFSVSESTQSKLVDYIKLLYKWNQIHNLTSIQDPLEMMDRHVLESLTLLPYLPSQSELSKNTAQTFQILDVGTGAGLPGIPLALCRPDCRVVLLDSNQKKINFVEHVIISLSIPNATAVSARVEQYKSQVLFDWVVSRAFASLSQFVRLSQPLCQPKGRWVAMKSASWDESETDDMPVDVAIEKIESVLVPNSEVVRSLIFVCRNE